MDRDSMFYAMRMEFAMMPRWVYVSRAEQARKRATRGEEELERFNRAGARWLFTRRWWLVYRRMLWHTFLAGVFEAMPDGGGVAYRYDSSARRRNAIISGVTS